MKTAPLPLIVPTELGLRVLASLHKGRFNPLTHCSPRLLGGAPFSLLILAGPVFGLVVQHGPKYARQFVRDSDHSLVFAATLQDVFGPA